VDGIVVIIRVPVTVEALGVHGREQVGDGDELRAAVRAVAAGRAGDEELAAVLPPAALAAEPYALILPQSTSKIQRDFLLCFAWAQTNSEKQLNTILTNLPANCIL
jgi:formaldehyde-activating enzyme involved in methanogenesis